MKQQKQGRHLIRRPVKGCRFKIHISRFEKGFLMIVLQNVSSSSIAGARVKSKNCCFALAKHAFLFSKSGKNSKTVFVDDMILRLICLNIKIRRSAGDISFIECEKICQNADVGEFSKFHPLNVRRYGKGRWRIHLILFIECQKICQKPA